MGWVSEACRLGGVEERPGLRWGVAWAWLTVSSHADAVQEHQVRKGHLAHQAGGFQEGLGEGERKMYRSLPTGSQLGPEGVRSPTRSYLKSLMLMGLEKS